MNNTEKLLRAFIEVSGYEVEEFTNQSPIICLGTGERDIAYIKDYKVTKGKLKQGLDDNKLSEPRSRVDIDKVLDTKSTINGVVVMVNDTSIDQLVKNIVNLSQLTSNLRFIRHKKCDFDRVIGWFGDLAKRQGDTYYLILNVEVFLDE